jgi:hypothetical protein
MKKASTRASRAQTTLSASRSEPTSLMDFAASFRGQVIADLDNNPIHPCGGVFVGRTLRDLFHAADHNDAAEVARWIRLINSRIKLEREWEVESLAAAGD